MAILSTTANSAPSSAANLSPRLPDLQNRAENGDQTFLDLPAAPELALVPSASEAAAAAILEHAPERDTARVPRITIHAFHLDTELTPIFESAARDRLMSGARLTAQAGSVAAATEYYRGSPTPNLIILESQAETRSFLAELDGLAEVCDAGTRLMVVGHTNDIGFYRELVRRGVSEYLLAPVTPVSLVAAISSIYRHESSNKLGQTYAFIGAKGGVGSSTIAHNVSWTIGRIFSSNVILADMDLPFGTAALNFNTDAGQGVADAIHDASRLDHVLLDRLLTKCGDHLGLLSAPAALDSAYDLDIAAVEALVDVARSSVPFTVLDLPHQWSAWSKAVLESVDAVVIIATPDLASLRNTKNLLTILKQSRPHDPPPKLVLNQIGTPKRPEIKPRDFSKAVQSDLTACISFNPQLFGSAANKGQMVAEISSKGDAIKAFADVAHSVAALRGHKQHRSAASGMTAVFKRMLGK